MPDEPESKKQDRKLDTLLAEHRDLDQAIVTLTECTPYDQVQVARLKKRKLWLRDQISLLQGAATPNIIA